MPKTNKFILISTAIVFLAVTIGWLATKEKGQEPKVNLPKFDKKAEMEKKENFQEEIKSSPSVIGKIESIEGKVEKRESEQDNWIIAQIGDDIQSGTEIRTMESGRTVINFEDENAVRLDYNSQVKFQSDSEKTILLISKGIAFNRVEKNTARQYIVTTGEYTTTALGTIFSVLKKIDGTPEIMVFESKVEIKDKDGKSLGEATMGEKAEIKLQKFQKNKLSEADIKQNFIAWNIEKDKTRINLEELKKYFEKPAGKITLSGKKTEKDIEFSWKISNIDMLQGFKLVKSKEKDPQYPADDYKDISDGDKRSYEWKISDGKEYHFRVCNYDKDNQCLIYSNDIAIKAPGGNDYATGIVLSAKKEDDAAKLEWMISGGKAPKGFKVMVSENENPVYPGNDYHSLTDPKAVSDEWKKDDSSKKLETGKSYHFRICVYGSESCETYSNDVQVDF